MARSASSARSAQSARSVRSAMSVIHPADKVCTGQRDGQDLPHRRGLHSPAMSAGSTLPARSVRPAKVGKIGTVCLVGKVSAAGTAGKIYLADKVRTVSDVGKVRPVGIRIRIGPRLPPATDPIFIGTNAPQSAVYALAPTPFFCTIIICGLFKHRFCAAAIFRAATRRSRHLQVIH